MRASRLKNSPHRGLIVLRVPFTAAHMIDTQDTAAPKLSIRVSEDNRLHHLWNNNGTWWAWASLRTSEGRKFRHRFSLKTSDLEAARRKRDRILNAIAQKSGHIAA